MAPISIGQAIAASWRFLRIGWSRAWGVLLLVVWIAAMIQAVQQSRSDLAPLALVGDIALFVAGTAVAGALYRIGLEPDHPGDAGFRPGPAGFNWGALEWRVLAANVLVAVILGAYLFGAIIVWAFAFGVSAATQGADVQALEGAQGAQAQMAALTHILTGPAGAVSVIVGVPLAIGFALLGAKLALVAVASADAGRLDFGRAWSLTRGALAALIIATIVIFVAQFIVGLLAGFFAGVLAGGLGQGLAGSRLWGAVAAQAAGVAINGPLIAGLQLYVYRARRGDRNVASTFT